MWSFLQKMFGRNDSEETYELSWVTGQVAVGHAPMSYEEFDSLKRQGITAILNLCAELDALVTLERDAGFEVYFLPVPNEEPPDVQATDAALDWLDECVYLGKKALIHCRHGIGRTGTVVSSYLLRKGLGQKLVNKHLKDLRSKPSNLTQWHFLRQYGKAQGQLTIREPCLESRCLVDLSPFFDDIEALFAQIEDRAESATERCGREHAKCCFKTVRMSLAEAVYLHHMFNKSVTSEKRKQSMAAALEALQTRQALVRENPGLSQAALDARYEALDIPCPLLGEANKCQLFAYRPAACRVFDLRQVNSGPGVPLQRGLQRISDNLFMALTEHFMPGAPLEFDLNAVVSGKFVQNLFLELARKEAEQTAATD
ncbi:protein-tyrosine phosphatase family protein [Desulfohalobium retbaense]|uniref:Dual specificity protein phosphatase n=1 Tax=Desulfohalobium retbaense (strain ATCC 49708 / DSM 5692 / JCM 16813 / HR100) TaxID=485915 RepID=C8WZC6_DESRD|nr:dual specificity protein phosphatase family protein [Desulfohalobium retbaense]ACV67401.1 dual specificity protein phosphatase [Desulfohalobium retbaense DSM 5692]